jgi:SAM-dependent methyltransferase
MSKRFVAVSWGKTNPLINEDALYDQAISSASSWPDARRHRLAAALSPLRAPCRTATPITPKLLSKSLSTGVKRPSVMREMICTTCGATEYRVLFEARLPPVADLDFAPRRASTRYHARMVECARCGQVYSNPYFEPEALLRLYKEASYVDEVQVGNYAADQFREFQRAVGSTVDPKLRVLEVGCSGGYFLRQLKAHGYEAITGVEPGREAYQNIPADIRPHVINDFFRPDLFAPGSFDVVCCFQVLDHVPDPASFVRGMRAVLKPQGLFLAINHNIRAPITRFFGEKSPMFDIEHIYLFDKKTFRLLLSKTGFDVIRSESIRNSYTVQHALNMLPLPQRVRQMTRGIADRLGAASLSLSFPAGNMVAVGLAV